MVSKYIQYGLGILTIFMTGCFSNGVNIADYTKNITKKQQIPQVCKAKYKQIKPSVAIIDFTNNSDFGVATVNSQYNNHKAKFNVSFNQISAGAKSSRENTTRLVDPKLARSFIPLLERMVLDSGGTRLFTRADLDKVDAELKLQDSGLLDPSTVVEFGLTSGVKYLITGSIDYVKYDFTNYSNLTEVASRAVDSSDNEKLKIATAALNFAALLFDGTVVKTAITVKIIDVATGKIVFSEQVQKDTKINSQNKPSYSQLTGAVKECIAKAIPLLKTQFQEYFALTGYITKIRKNGNDGIARINLGREDNIKAGQEFVLVNLESSFDPITNSESCDLLPTNQKLIATKHISKSSSWLKFEDLDNIKTLQLIQRVK